MDQDVGQPNLLQPKIDISLALWKNCKCKSLAVFQLSLMKHVDYELDEKFKPGLYLQTIAFLSEDHHKLCSLDEQISSFSVYNDIANY